MAELQTPVFRLRTVPAVPMALPAPLDFGPAAAAEPFQWTGLPAERILRNVSAPRLSPVLPAPGRGSGRAVLVVPGGGCRFVAIENEGLSVAQRLAAAAAVPRPGGRRPAVPARRRRPRAELAPGTPAGGVACLRTRRPRLRLDRARHHQRPRDGRLPRLA